MCLNFRSANKNIIKCFHQTHIATSLTLNRTVIVTVMQMIPRFWVRNLKLWLWHRVWFRSKGLLGLVFGLNCTADGKVGLGALVLREMGGWVVGRR